VPSFFEPPEAPDEPPQPPVTPPRRVWHGPPGGVAGRAVALNLVIGRSAKAAVWIPWVTVYPEIFEFQLEVYQPNGEMFGDWYWYKRLHSPGGSRGTDGELAPELFRFGFQFSDGSKATNLNPAAGPRDHETPPASPILGGGGGGGGGDGAGGYRWQYSYWVWPLPPEGPLAFVCEWPIADIPETRSEVDSALIRDAAAEAVPLWPGSEAPSDSGG
jgi:hypothetical protein